MCKIELINTLINLVIASGGLLAAIIALVTYRHNKREEKFRDQCRYLHNALNKRELFRPYYHNDKSLPFVGVVKRLIPNSLDRFTVKGVQPTLYKIDKKLSLFDSFYYYLQCHIVVLEDGQELTRSQIIAIYNNFFENLVQRDVIDAAFNEIYNTIDEILTSSKSEKAILKKIRIVQSQFPSKQLILYFINQVQYADRQRFKNLYADNLKKYDFFKRMIESNEYTGIERLIPKSIEKLIYSGNH